MARLLKIFYIDDEHELCEIFRERFEGPDYDISCFLEAETALARMDSVRPDVVFIDYRIPGQNGVIASSRMPETVAKYLITGELDVAGDLNFSGILHKPIDYKRIDQILRDLLAKTV